MPKANITVEIAKTPETPARAKTPPISRGRQLPPGPVAESLYGGAHGEQHPRNHWTFRIGRGQWNLRAGPWLPPGCNPYPHARDCSGWSDPQPGRPGLDPPPAQPPVSTMAASRTNSQGKALRTAADHPGRSHLGTRRSGNLDASHGPPDRSSASRVSRQGGIDRSGTTLRNRTA